MIGAVAVPLAPMLAAVLCLTVGRVWRRYSGWLAVGGMSISTVLLIVSWGVPLTAEWKWLTVGSYSLSIGLSVDGLSWTIALLVASVSLLVNVYSIAYIQGGEDQPRYFAWMSLFAGAMLALVLANSWVLLFAAWELVGVCSWALIGFDHGSPSARRGAWKALLTTRTADCGFLLAWLLILISLRTTGIQEFLAAVNGGELDRGLLRLVAILFLAAAVGKSAQLPLSAWLPDAMAGPSPVSALLHSATMVAAGVYLLLRLYPLYQALPEVLHAVLWIGGATALAAALVATVERDLKRILAWSTISQIGEMMVALGLAGPIAAVFHLVIHATFKPGLFLTAGLVEHATGTRQLGELGGLERPLRIEAWLFGTCGLSLAGFPFLSGYWSEERILARAADAGTGWAALVVILVGLAGVYMGRASAAVVAPWRHAAVRDGRRRAALALIPIGVLAVGAVALGFMLKTPLERVLPFSSAGSEAGRLWPVAAMAASAAGLIWGWWNVIKRGAGPALGPFPAWLGQAVDAVTVPARAVPLVAGWVQYPERGLEAVGRLASWAADRFSGVLQAAEVRWNALAVSAARLTVQAAGAAVEAEKRGFQAGGNGLAFSLRAAGERVQMAQSGKVYLYTLAVFAWVLIASVTFVVLWL